MSAPSAVSSERFLATSNKSAVRSKLVGLQILRFVAAFSVVLFHVGSGYQLKWNYETNIFGFGAAGVDIFFVISGFIIAYSTDAAKGARHFCQRRLVRIVPLYWSLTLGVAAIALLKPDLLNSTLVNGETLIKSLFFIPFEKPNGAIQPILFLGWTLNYEMFFYAVYAACIAVGLRGPIAPAMFIVLLVAAGQIVQFDHVAWRFYTSPLMLEFVFGIVLFLLYSRWPALFLGRGTLIAILAAMLLLRQVLPELPWIVANGIPAAALVAATLPWLPRQTQLVSLLVLFGDASYSLYLSHPYIIQAIAKFLPDDASLGAQIASGVVACCISIIVSVALYKVIERPSQKALNVWLAARRSAVQPA